jgi:CRP/FNR family transcriptional regulator
MYNIEELRYVSCFEHLNKDELNKLFTISRKKDFVSGEILFYEKDQPKSLILLLDGVLKIYKTDAKNNEVVMHRFHQKSLIAEMAIMENIPYPASASFETDGSVIEIDFDKFKTMFLSNPEIALNFFKSLSKKIKYLENVIALNIVLDSTARVAKYICENDEALSMKHTVLSQYLHMTPETLSRIFKKFIKLGFIEKKGTVYKIKDKNSLKIIFE